MPQRAWTTVSEACATTSCRNSAVRWMITCNTCLPLMGGIVFAIKNTAQVERPDGSNRHSFPSGHTATAFMTATMLNKEYGYKSPWVGIGAYSVATATGLMRMANNKHWLSDVLAGAGIGIITTEIGYLLADLIFKEKGINHAHEINYSDLLFSEFTSAWLRYRDATVCRTGKP